MEMLKWAFYCGHFFCNPLLGKTYNAHLQRYRLRKIIHHAYETSGFYRDWFDKAGIRPSQIRKPADLRLIPAITKSQIQDRYDFVVSKTCRSDNCRVRNTSGSSGKMLRVVWDEFNFMTRLLLYVRAFSMIGYGPFKRLVYLLPVVENAGFRQRVFSNRAFTPNKPFSEIRDALMDYQPHVLSIYPSYAMDLADQLRDDDIRKMGIRAISLNSEMVMGHEIAHLEKRFQCPVYVEYSSVEMGMIAAQCKHKGLHVFNDNVILEILDEQGNALPPGQRGEVALTALNSFAMPFIRYRIGDYSSLYGGKCACGNPYPMLGPIEGRRDDTFILPDGRIIPAWQLYEVIERPLERHGFRKLVLSDFYLLQKDRDRVAFYYVRGPDFHAGSLDEIMRRTKELLGNAVSLAVTETDNIDRVKSVKRKYIHRQKPSLNHFFL